MRADAPLCTYPQAKQFSCPCEREGCIDTFETWEDTVASALQHTPGLRGEQVRIAAGYWTADSPQDVVFKVIQSASLEPETAPAEHTQADRELVESFWPLNKSITVLRNKPTYWALQKPQVREKVEQLLHSAATWSGKQPIGQHSV